MERPETVVITVNENCRLAVTKHYVEPDGIIRGKVCIEKKSEGSDFKPVYIDALNLVSSRSRIGYAKRCSTETGEDEAQIKDALQQACLQLEEYYNSLSPDDFAQNNKDPYESPELMLEGFSFQEVHPAIDFTKEDAFIGVHLPCKSSGGRENLAHCIVTDSRDVFISDQKELEKRGIRLKCLPVIKENRWTTSSIKEFIESSNIHSSPKTIFKKIRNLYKSHIDFCIEDEYDIISLWGFGTYFLRLFNTYPYLKFGGILGSGKTKTGTITKSISFNGFMSADISPASLFRLSNAHRATIVIDEGEKLSYKSEKTEALVSILNSGYKKGSCVLRTEKDKNGEFGLESYETFCPIMICSVGGIGTETLEDRTIEIIMIKTLKKEISDSEINEDCEAFRIIRDNLYLCLLENWKTVAYIYRNIKNDTSLSNRAWELWKPLIALAKFIDGELYKKVKSIAEEKTKEKNTKTKIEDRKIILVDALDNLVDEDDFYSVKKIRDETFAILGFEEYPRWLTHNWIGRVLTNFRIERRRTSAGVEYRLNKELITNMKRRLSVEIPAQISQTTQLSIENSVNREESEDSSE